MGKNDGLTLSEINLRQYHDKFVLGSKTAPVELNYVTIPAPGNNADDEIYVKGNHNQIIPYSGNNTVGIIGSNNTITTDNGRDSITANGNKNTINAGAGNDTVVLSGEKNTVIAGDGNDKISVSGGTDGKHNHAELGAGQDQVTVKGFVSINLDESTDEVDTITFGGNAQVSVSNLKENDVFDLSVGRDTVSLEQENNKYFAKINGENIKLYFDDATAGALDKILKIKINGNKQLSDLVGNILFAQKSGENTFILLPVDNISRTQLTDIATSPYDIYDASQTVKMATVTKLDATAILKFDANGKFFDVGAGITLKLDNNANNTAQAKLNGGKVMAGGYEFTPSEADTNPVMVDKDGKFTAIGNTFKVKVTAENDSSGNITEYELASGKVIVSGGTAQQNFTYVYTPDEATTVDASLSASENDNFGVIGKLAKIVGTDNQDTITPAATGFDSVISIDAAANDDEVVLTAAGLKGTNVTLGAGADTLTLGAVKKATVSDWSLAEGDQLRLVSPVNHAIYDAATKDVIFANGALLNVQNLGYAQLLSLMVENGTGTAPVELRTLLVDAFYVQADGGAYALATQGIINAERVRQVASFAAK